MSFFHKSGPPAWLIVGLGNPGRQYEFTRHNAGFLCVDVLANEAHVKIDRLKFSALTGLGELGGVRCLFLKPQPMMNLSGESVQEAAQFYKIPPERTLVIFDDISLPCGTLRIRRKGSDGGHNGIKSLNRHLGSQEFPRIKLGVGAKPHPDFDLADWVLSTMNKQELEALRAAITDACSAAELIVRGKIDDAMGSYN